MCLVQKIIMWAFVEQGPGGPPYIATVTMKTSYGTCQANPGQIFTLRLRATGLQLRNACAKYRS